MRSIFITNDDGIDAEGIIRLANTAKEFGDVWVVAPDGQHSAASHSISLREPVDVYPHDFPVEGVHAFSCNGTPADCVRVGTLNIVPHRMYNIPRRWGLRWRAHFRDIVLSHFLRIMRYITRLPMPICGRLCRNFWSRQSRKDRF